jgi:predicted cupin superfamily sugar epimerase
LIRHPEGGYFRETYRSPGTIELGQVTKGSPRPRPVSTAIYYLLEGSDFSAFHRIRSDELWHHYAGGILAIHTIDAGGRYNVSRLASHLEGGCQPQRIVPAGTWFAAEVEDASGYVLVGCTVAPGFDFEDFEIGRRDDLVQRFPAHRSIIQAFTRG